MRQRRTRIAASAGAVALMATFGLSACSGDETPAAEPATEAPALAETGPESEDVETPAGLPDFEFDEIEMFHRTPGPLEEIMNEVNPWVVAGGDTDEERSRGFQQQIVAVFTYTAQCMQEHGFTFLVNNDPSFGTQRAVREEVNEIMGTRAFVAEFGLGITNPAFYSLILGTDEDPNAEQLAEMSEAERAEWDLALNGDFNLPFDDPNFARGCSQEGNDRVFQPMMDQDHEFAALAAETQTLMGRLANTHWMGASPIEEEWSACMVSRGHPAFINPWDMTSQMQGEWQNLAFSGFDWSTWDGNLGFPPPDLATISDADRANFAAREFELAIDGWNCEQQVDFRARHQAWDHEEQAAFVEQHRDELDAWILSVRAAQAATES